MTNYLGIYSRSQGIARIVTVTSTKEQVVKLEDGCSLAVAALPGGVSFQIINEKWETGTRLRPNGLAYAHKGFVVANFPTHEDALEWAKTVE
jgi:hypothetical protein